MQPVTLYTTPICPYCVSAKRLLAHRGIPYAEVDVSRDPDLRDRLSRENGGYSTVPMIFIADRFIGGFTELSALDRSGELARRLETAS